MKTVELTDDIRQEDQPLAWLVFCPEGSEMEYQLFDNVRDARDAAMEYGMTDPEVIWAVYPLYAGHPLEKETEE